MLSASVALQHQAVLEGSFMAKLRGEGVAMWRRKRSGPQAGFDAWMTKICAAQSWGATRAARLEKRCAFVVAGRNSGWKTESGMGTEQNRRFHGIARSKMLALLREKLDVPVVALVLAEESRASRVSFAH